MNTKKIIQICIIIFVLGECFLGIKLYNHEMRQNTQIAQIPVLQGEIDKLSNDNSVLKEKLDQVVNYYNFSTDYKDDSFNYLAIGNSLTLISSWGRGICATQPGRDYFGLVVSSLKKVKNKNVVAYPYNFANWERNMDRGSCLSLLNPFLSDKLNLVTIQLGENVKDTATYEKDLENLIRYIHKKAPKAQIIVIGDFWDNDRNKLRKQAAQNVGCAFADLSAIIGDKAYQSQKGIKATLLDGSIIEVSKEAETHPGDRGMEYIAQKVFAVIK